MFDARRDDVVACGNQARNRKIVGLGAAAGENDFRSATTKQRRYGLAGVFDGSPRLLPMMMDGGSIAELLSEIRTHRLEHVGQQRSRGVIVEVNAVHNRTRFYSTLRKSVRSGRHCWLGVAGTFRTTGTGTWQATSLPGQRAAGGFDPARTAEMAPYGHPCCNGFHRWSIGTYWLG